MSEAAAYFATQSASGEGACDMSEVRKPQVGLPVLLEKPCDCISCEHKTRHPIRRLKLRSCFSWVKKYLIGLAIVFAVLSFVLSIRWSLEVQDKYEWADAVIRPTGDCYQPLRIRTRRDIPARCKEAVDFVSRSFFGRYWDIVCEDFSAFTSWFFSVVGMVSVALWVVMFLFVVNVLDRWSAATNFGFYLNMLTRSHFEKGAEASV